MGVRGMREVGSEQVEGPKVLFEGVPLRAALHQGGRVGPIRGLPRISVS